MKNKSSEKKYRIAEIGEEDACRHSEFSPIGKTGRVRALQEKDNGFVACDFYFDTPFTFFLGDDPAPRMCFWDIKIEEV